MQTAGIKKGTDLAGHLACKRDRGHRCRLQQQRRGRAQGGTNEGTTQQQKPVKQRYYGWAKYPMYPA
jgi:hypothetical protein